MTSPGGEWAKAKVAAELDWSNLSSDMRARLIRETQIAERAVRANFARMEQYAKQAFTRMGTKYSETMRSMTRQTTAMVTAVSRKLDALDGRNIDVRVNVAQTGADAAELKALSASLRRLDKIGRNIQISIKVDVTGTAEVERLAAAIRALPRRTRVRVDGDTSSTSRLTSSLGEKGGLLGALRGLAGGAVSAMGTIGKFTAIAGAATVAVAGMLPAVAALSAALGGALVAGAGAGAVGITALLAATATIKVATAGMGDAFKNAFDPANADKFAEAMAKLSPAAQGVVKSVQGVVAAWKASGAQMAVQESFFAGIGAQLTTLATNMMPAVRASMLTIADGFNEGATSALKFMNSTTGIGQMQDILAGSSNVAANFGAALGNLVPGLLAIGASANNVFAPLSDGIGGAARSLSDFLVAAQQSGQIDTFFQNAIGVARQLGAVLGQLGGVLSGVFKAAAAAGNGNFLGSLTTSLTSINEWVNGPGASALTSFFQSSAAAVGTLLPLILQLAGIVGGQVAPAIAGLVTQLGPAASGLISNFGLAIAQLVPVMPTLGSAISAIANAVGPVLPILGQLIAQIVQFAGPIIGSLAAALSPVLQAIGTGLVSAMQALMPAVQPISNLFAALSPILAQVAVMLGQTLSGALTVLVPVFIGLVNAVTAVLPAVQGLMQMLTPLAPVIGAVAAAVVVAIGAFKLIQGVIAIIRAVQVAWTLLNLAFAISPIGAIVVAIAALAAGLALFFTKTETGRKIWDAIWNGIKSTFTAVWNVIKAAWDAVWPVLQSGLKAIGTAVSWVADHWKIFAAILTGPIGIIIGLAAKFGILQAAIRLVGTVITWLWQNIFVPAFSAIGSLISTWWAGVQVIWAALQAAFQAVGAVVMWFWNTVIAPAFAAIGAIISAWWAGVQAIWNMFTTAISTVASAVAGFVTGVISWFTNLAASIISTVSGWVSNVINAVAGFVSSVSATISGWVSNVVGFFTNLASSVGSTVSGMWTSAVNFFRTGIDNAVSLVTGLKDKVVNALKGAGSWLIDTGKNIIEGLISGIKSMLSSIGNAIVSIFPRIIQGPVRSALGLATGGLVEMAGGGLVPVIGSIAHARMAQRFRSGGPVRGRGGPTDDLIPAMLSNGEFVVPAHAVNQQTLPILEGMRAGRGVSAYADGGLVSATKLQQFAQGVEGKPYVWGGVNWGDCSGAVSALANYASGRAPFDSRFATAGEAAALKERGFLPGLGPAGSLNVGWYNGGPGGGHTAATLPDGTHFEMGGARGDGQYGGKAAGADDAQFTDHAHLPPEHFTGLDGGSKTTGTPSLGGATTTGGGGSTPIGSGISSGSSWGNSGGGSKYNSAAEAKRGGITPVWVENWPASIGGGGGSLGANTTDTTSLTAGTPSTTGTPAAPKSLKKGASKQDMIDAVYRIGKAKGMSDEQILAGAETLLAESNGQNYANSNVAGSTARPHDAVGSDGKSLGVMQQQSGMGWGSDDQLMDPEYAIGKFFDTMKKQGTSGAAHSQAQAVQRSAFADGSNYAAKKSEAEKLLANAKKSGTVPVTTDGTVPVTVKNTADTTALTNTTGTPTTTGTPSTTATPTTTDQTKAYESMPYGIDRANSWAGTQDFATQAGDVGVDAVKETFGGFLEPFGLNSLFEKGIDQLVEYLKTQRQETPTTTKFADNVTFNGMDPNKTKSKVTEGMTAATETYRQG